MIYAKWSRLKSCTFMGDIRGMGSHCVVAAFCQHSFFSPLLPFSFNFHSCPFFSVITRKFFHFVQQNSLKNSLLASLIPSVYEIFFLKHVSVFPAKNSGKHIFLPYFLLLRQTRNPNLDHTDGWNEHTLYVKT